MNNFCDDGRKMAIECNWFWYDEYEEPTEWNCHVSNCRQCYKAMCNKERENDNR